MADLPDNCVQCVVTSPPYWGLRKYEGAQDSVWGGKEDCAHQFNVVRGVEHPPPGASFALGAKLSKAVGFTSQNGVCSLCGAWKGSYGLEATPEMYVQHSVEILREIRCVLREDGVVFWNIGDSYAGSGSPGGGALKPKDLCLVPFRVAIGAQEDGWWVRSVIIWHKPNPMPESVKDRPTESHEYILMLTKSAKYYWDMEAVREKNSNPQRTNFVSGARTYGKNKDRNDNDLGERSKAFAANGRNIRSVWTFATQPFKGAHFATFPEKLPELCIKAATPEVGCCSKCGTPWERVVEKHEYPPEVFTKARRPRDNLVRSSVTSDGRGSSGKLQKWLNENPLKTLGWQPQCKCNAEKIPSIVLDPFAGSGTTLKVASELGRRAIGYEISEEYCKLAVERITKGKNGGKDK